MAFHKRELKQTDSGTYGREVELVKVFYVWSDNGVTDNANQPGPAMQWLLNQAGGFGQAPLSLVFPDSAIVCIFSRIHFDSVGDYQWQFTITYTPPESWRGTGDNAFQFNTMGGTQHITQGLSHQATYAPGDSNTVTTAQDGALNRDSNGVNGIDIDTGQFAFQVTIYRATIPNTYVELLRTLTNTVNGLDITITADGVSRTLLAGEGRFKGATGCKRGFTDWEITLNFVEEHNQTDLSVGEGDNQISGIAKDGWDYMSVEYEEIDDTTNNFLAAAPSLVYIDQIYLYANWTGIIP